MQKVIRRQEGKLHGCVAFFNHASTRLRLLSSSLLHASRFTSHAFTLAEVLITLGIIGIVAAITVPVIMNNAQDAQYKTAYKKAFSDASNIWQSMRANNEIESCTSACDDNCSGVNFITFKSYMKVIKSCGTNISADNVKDCWDISGEAFAGSIPNSSTGSGAIGFIDNSGRNWIMLRGASTCRVAFAVDINGLRSPNKFGKDRQYLLGGLDDGTVFAFTGIPTKLYPVPDRISSTSQTCGYPPCYSTSWLYN